MRGNGASGAALAPHWWAESGTGLVTLAPASDSSPFIIAVPTPQTNLRGQARERVRDALRTSLGNLLGCAPEAVPLEIEPGQAPALMLPTTSIHLSISHEAGLSLAAIRVGGRIGIDLMASDAALSDQEALARDYLGPQAAAAMQSAPTAEQQVAFARLWTAHEACLKCLGLPLQEWSPDLAGQIARCRVAALRLPGNYVGAAAFLN